MLLIAVCLLSAVLFAAGNSLQHLGANNLGGEDLPPLKIAARLARNRTWLFGSAIALTAFATHLLALDLGHVGVVQPLLLIGVVFGIVFRPLLDGARAHRVELAGAAMAVAGLALYIRSGAIYDTTPVDPLSNGAVTTACVVGVVSLLLVSARRLPVDISVVFALCAGLLMGTGAGLFKQLLSADTLHDKVVGWELPVALGLEIAGTFLNQRAYHTGPMARTMPIVNLASVLIGGLFGALVFGELPLTDPLHLLGQVLGIALAAAGLVILSRHHRSLEEERATQQEVAAG